MELGFHMTLFLGFLGYVNSPYAWGVSISWKFPEDLATGLA